MPLHSAASTLGLTTCSQGRTPVYQLSEPCCSPQHGPRKDRPECSMQPYCQLDEGVAHIAEQLIAADSPQARPLLMSSGLCMVWRR